jgi:glycosyltransferase involved in cell wall biosynthesis
MGVRIEDVGAPAGPPAEPFTIGYLARICPEKGLANLCAAFIHLRRAGRNCRLRVAGHLRPTDQPYLERIRALLRAQHVNRTFEHVGEVDRAGKLEFLRSLHVLSVPTVYHEAKGFYVLEAMACGVPVVQPRHGSFPELLDATGGGLLYDPAEPDALADSIAALMDDPQQRARLAERGRSGVRESFTDEIMAEQAWLLYRRYCSDTAA